MLIAVLLVAINMRPTITGVGPLLDQMSTDLGQSLPVLGILASLPLIAWGIFSPLVHDVSSKFGQSKTIFWSLVFLALGTIWRSVPGPEINLWLGTILIGACLAVTNVLMPAVIRREFSQRVPFVMSLFSGVLGAAGAIASGIVVPISRITTDGQEWGWRYALLATGLLIPVALVLWVWSQKYSREARETPLPRKERSSRGIWSDATAWQITAFMGLQATSFYILVTWLATIAMSQGRSEAVAGVDVMVFQFFCVASAFLLPLILTKKMVRWVPGLLPSFAITGILGLIFAPDLIVLWYSLVGLSQGASLSMSFTLMAQRSKDNGTAAAVSGMAQSVGYLMAALGPIIFGWIHSIAGGWVLSLSFQVLILLSQATVGFFLGRDRFILEKSKK